MRRQPNVWLQGQVKHVTRCRYALVGIVLLFGIAFASHYTGTYTHPDGDTLILQHNAEGRLVGRWVWAEGVAQLEGQAVGDTPGQGRVFDDLYEEAFESRISPDGNTLTMTLAAIDSSGQVLWSEAEDMVFTRQSHDASSLPEPVTPSREPEPEPTPQPVTPAFVPYENSSYAYRISHPIGWQVETSSDDYVLLMPAPSSASYRQIAVEVIAEADYSGSLQEGSDDILAALRQNVLPDLQVLERNSTQVAGVPAQRIVARGTGPSQDDLTANVTVLVQEERIYVMNALVMSEHYQTHRPILEEMLASMFIATTPSPEPEPVEDADFGGTYSNEQLSLELEGEASQYSGQLDFGGQTFPVAAEASGSALTGSFESSGNRFAFTATLDGTTLTFVTSNVTHVLEKHVAEEPCNPLDPDCAAPEPEPCNPLDPGCAAPDPEPEPEPRPCNPFDPACTTARSLPTWAIRV